MLAKIFCKTFLFKLHFENTIKSKKIQNNIVDFFTNKKSVFKNSLLSNKSLEFKRLCKHYIVMQFNLTYK